MKYDKISIKIFKFFLFSVQVDYSDVYYIVNYTKIYSVKKSMISNRNAHVDNNLKYVSSGSLIFCDWVYFCIDIDFPSYRSKNQRCLSQLHRLMLYIYSYLSKPHPKLDTQCTGKYFPKQYWQTIMRRITKNIDRTFFDSEKGVASKGAPKNRGDKQLSYTVIIVILSW